MLWLYLDFYQLTLDAALLQAPQSGPVIVYHQADNRIVQCCPQARQRGVETGMGMAQAAALCPGLHIINYHSEQENQQLHGLAQRLYQLVTDIAVLPPDSLAIRLDPHVRYYGGLGSLWLTLQHELRNTGCQYHYGTGWSVEAAKVLARAQSNRLLSNPTEIRQQLNRARIHHTDLTDKQKQALNRVGIRSLQALLAMPATELGKRFHNDMIRYLCALNGSQVPKVTTFHPREHYQRYQELSFEADNTARVLPWITALLEDLQVFLRIRNKRTAELQLSLYFRDEPSLLLKIQAAAPMAQQQEWFALITLKMENLILPAPVVAIQLCCEQLEEIAGQSNDFFHDRFQYFSQMQLIGRLQARLGKPAVSQPVLIDDHRFEPYSEASADSPPDTLHGYPAMTCQPPQPLTLNSHIVYGPVRLHTGWWDTYPVCRDYYIAITDSGQHLHVFKDPARGWFLAGWYC